MSRFTRTAALIGVALLAVSACGSDSKSSSSSSVVTTTASTSGAVDSTGASTPATGTPATDTATTGSVASTDVLTSGVDSGGDFSVKTPSGTVTLAAKPVKIISLAPTHTESLFAIGAGAQVIAVDDQSNFPAEAAAVSSTLSGYTPNVEAIAGYKPDLVVVSDDSGGIVAQLAALNIPVWVGPAATSLDDVYTEIEQLGVLTGHTADAVALVANMQSGITEALAGLPDSERAITYYHELDNTYFTVTSNTFIGQIYAFAGLINIADGAESANDYPQLNSEFIISADPQLIFLADTKCCGETPATVAARDGWANIAAVKNKGVIAVDDDIASRWGPRVVDYVEEVVAAVQTAAQVPAG